MLLGFENLNICEAEYKSLGCLDRILWRLLQDKNVWDGLSNNLENFSYLNSRKPPFRIERLLCYVHARRQLVWAFSRFKAVLYGLSFISAALKSERNFSCRYYQVRGFRSHYLLCYYFLHEYWKNGYTWLWSL